MQTGARFFWTTVVLSLCRWGDHHPSNRFTERLGRAAAARQAAGAPWAPAMQARTPALLWLQGQPGRQSCRRALLLGCGCSLCGNCCWVPHGLCKAASRRTLLTNQRCWHCSNRNFWPWWQHNPVLPPQAPYASSACTRRPLLGQTKLLGLRPAPENALSVSILTCKMR